MQASQNTKLLKLAFNVRRKVSGALSCSDLRLTWSAELLRLALNAGLLRPASEVSVLLGMRGPRFSSKRDLHVEVRLASDDLSLLIFDSLQQDGYVLRSRKL